MDNSYMSPLVLDPKLIASLTKDLSELKTQGRFMAKGKDMRVIIILKCTDCDKKKKRLLIRN